jgi:DNA-binding transcriptional ArsR family regulator
MSNMGGMNVEQISVGEPVNLFDPSSMSFSERQSQLDAQKKAEDDERQRMKRSPFSRWTQFNNEHTRELMHLALKHPKAHAILYFLVDQMDEYNAVLCSYQVIQGVLGIGRTTAHNSIKVLKENGFIAILKSGTSNVYAINDSVYWKSWGNKKQYSKFPANVVLSLSEQEELTQTKVKSMKLKEVQIKE